MNVATRPDAATSRGYKTGMLLTAEILIFDLVTRGVEEGEKGMESSGYTGAEITAARNRECEKDSY